MKKKSLVGWTRSNWSLHHYYNNIIDMKRIDHNPIYSYKYLRRHNTRPVKVRITIEELPPKKG